MTNTTPSTRIRPETHFRQFSLSPSRLNNSNIIFCVRECSVLTKNDCREDDGDDRASEDDTESIRNRHEADTGKAAHKTNGSSKALEKHLFNSLLYLTSMSTNIKYLVIK